MMINELPRNVIDIATTYFEDPKIQSQFKKDMDNNMKMLSGLDPVVTDQELSDKINYENNALIDNGTAEAMLERSDRESLEMLTQNMYQMGVMSRTNPDIAAADYYTQNEMANEAAVNDMYRINLTNSKRDPRLYSTKSTIAYEKIVEAADGLQPNYVRNTVRYLGQPALAIGMTVGGGKVGAGLTDAVMAGWDYSILGDTIYNTQEYYNNRYLDIINNDSLSLEQFNEEMSNFVKDIQINVAPEYQFEIFNSLLEGSNPFADAGLAFTSVGVQTYLKPFGFLAQLAKRALPFKRSNSLKRMLMNQELSEKIKKSITNTVDEAAVDENIATKVAEVAPKDTKQTDIDTVKGIMKNDINDSKLLSNNNNDTSFFNRLLRGLAGADEKTGSNQRGEIRLEEPDQSYYIDHGKGVDNDPMTLEEAERELKRLQGRKSQVLYRERYIREENLDEVPEYVAITTASKTPWDSLHVEYRPRTGEGSEAYGGGMYATFADSDWEASRKTYFKNALEKSDKAVLNTHYIPNPEKHPEMYLYYDAEDPGLKPFAINVLNTKSDKYFKIAEKQQKIIRSAIKDIEAGLQKRIQDAIKEGNTDLVNQLQFDHSFLLDHYNGDMTIFSWADYLRENVYGLDKPSYDFRSWEKEYWKNKGIKGLIHEGEGSTSTNIVIFDEDITSPVTKVETVDTQTGYNNAHMIVSAGDGVGYFVRELHSVKNAKPMIIKNGKVVDFGDYKEYNNKK